MLCRFFPDRSGLPVTAFSGRMKSRFLPMVGNDRWRGTIRSRSPGSFFSNGNIWGEFKSQIHYTYHNR